jgi:hypothetical protein
MITGQQPTKIFGHDSQLWASAKEEARRILLDVAKASSLIEYGELARQMKNISFNPHGYDFHGFLGELSSESDAAGAGIITAVVVRQSDKTPGDGFFSLAKDLGRDVSNREKCWADEVGCVYLAAKK